MRYALVLLSMLAGCGLSPTYKDARVDEEMTRNSSSCEKLGFAKGSKENADCSLRMFEASRNPSVNVR